MYRYLLLSAITHIFNPLKPSGYSVYQPVKHPKILRTVYGIFLFMQISEKKNYFPIQYLVTGFITDTENVYCAVRTVH
jgi:hypothetical protein